jgi:hypothetical protein
MEHVDGRSQIKLANRVADAVAALLQIVVMAAIAATLLAWPVGIVLAVVFSFFGVPLESFVTFGGVLNRITGLLALWLIGFAVALPYAVLVAFNAPIGARSFPWQKKR